MSEKPEKTWKQIAEQAEDYKRVGMIDHYLGYLHTEFPWDFVTEVEPGGSHRLEMSTSVSFAAVHPSGLRFRWSFDIEKRGADGKGYYELDIAGCKRIMSVLPPEGRTAFRAYLLDAIQKVEAKADEWQAITDRQREFGRGLREIVS